MRSPPPELQGAIMGDRPPILHRIERKINGFGGASNGRTDARSRAAGLRCRLLTETTAQLTAQTGKPRPPAVPLPRDNPEWNMPRAR